MAYPRLCLSMLSGCQYTSYTLTSLTILSSYRHFPVWVSFSWNLSLTTGKGFELTKGDVLQQLVNLHSDNMCTGKCSRCIAVTLYPLALISIICNIVLFFPGGDIKYAKDGHITEEVKYMGGLVGGGLMVSCVFSSVLPKGVTLDWNAAVNSLVKYVQPRKDTSHLKLKLKKRLFTLHSLSLYISRGTM